MKFYIIVLHIWQTNNPMKIRSITCGLYALLFVLFSSASIAADPRSPQKEENGVDVRVQLESAKKQLAEMRMQLGEFHPRVTEQVLKIAALEEAVRKLELAAKTQAGDASLRAGMLVTLGGVTVSPEKIYGDDIVAKVRSATRAEAQRVVTSDYVESPGGPTTLKVTPKGDLIRLSAENLALLKSAFLKESQSDPSALPFCIPTPGIRYTFHSPAGSGSILVCYQCQIALVEREGRVGKDEAYVGHVISELRKVVASFLTADEVAKLP